MTWKKQQRANKCAACLTGSGYPLCKKCWEIENWARANPTEKMKREKKAQEASG